jgi:hypothetical protein
MAESPNPLTKDDVDALKNVQGVDIVGYSTFVPGLVEWGDDDFQVAFVVSVPPGEQGGSNRRNLWVSDKVGW